jgi:hypothetical protein
VIESQHHDFSRKNLPVIFPPNKDANSQSNNENFLLRSKVPEIRYDMWNADPAMKEILAGMAIDGNDDDSNAAC